jgi:hypothetical protein
MVDGHLARVDTRVLQGRAPARYVAHRRDGTWFVGARNFTDRGPRGFRDTTMETVVTADPSLGDVMRLRRGRHAWRVRTRDAWIRSPLPEGDVHLLAYEVRPSALRSRGSGAFVNAWIRRRSLTEARRAARAEIGRAGYRIVAVDHEERVSFAECAPGGRKHFRQAEIDGEALVLHHFSTGKGKRRRIR